MIKKIIQQIFSLRNTESHKVLTILGLKFKMPIYKKHLFQNKEFLYDLTKTHLQAISLHTKTFSGYKNIYKGKTVVLCGAGPTLNKYIPIENAIHVALNRAFLFDKVDFDYIFACDLRGIQNYMQELADYKPTTCTKFIGYQNCSEITDIPESYTNKFKCKRFYTDVFAYPNCKFTVDISTAPLGNFNSIAFPALQFILYTNPDKIYLVGCDVSTNGHFTNIKQIQEQIDKNIKDLETIQITWLKQWAEFKKFSKIYYPDTSIVSVNPVGLKGLFDDDVYTNNICEENTEK